MPPLHPRYKLFRDRVDRFARALRGVDAGDVRAVHRTRVASRRLRELLPVAQLDGRTAEKLAERLRRTARRLGAVRELDVLLGTIDEMRASGDSSRRALAALDAEIRRTRDEVQPTQVSARLVRELHRIARKLDAVAGTLERQPDNAVQERAWRWAVEARAARRAGALRDAIGAAGAIYVPERLHVVRIALKKFRYAVEVAEIARGDNRRDDLNRLRRAQDLLGRLHDLQVLMERARQTQTSVQLPDVRTWREFDLLIATLEKECRRLHARYMRERPAIVAVCEKYAAKALRARHTGGRRAG